MQWVLVQKSGAEHPYALYLRGAPGKMEPLDIIIRMQPRQSVGHSYSRCPGWPFPAFPYFIIELFQKKFSRRLW